MPLPPSLMIFLSPVPPGFQYQSEIKNLLSQPRAVLPVLKIGRNRERNKNTLDVVDHTQRTYCAPLKRDCEVHDSSDCSGGWSLGLDSGQVGTCLSIGLFVCLGTREF